MCEVLNNKTTPYVSANHRSAKAAEQNFSTWTDGKLTMGCVPAFAD